MLGAFVFFLVDASLTREAVLDWGWRIPFLFGILLGAANPKAPARGPRPRPAAARGPRPPDRRARAERGAPRGCAQSIGMPPVTGTSAPDM
jgi:MFS family permease